MIHEYRGGLYPDVAGERPPPIEPFGDSLDPTPRRSTTRLRTDRLMRPIPCFAGLLLAFGLPALAHAQDASVHTTTPPVATAAPRQGPIVVDGVLGEEGWQTAPPAGDLRQYQPEEGAAASHPTELRVLYDDNAIYIGARMTQPGGVVAPLARRDQLLDASGDNGSFNSLTTDKLIVRLDPYHNHLDDAWFEVNPAGAWGDQFNGDPSWDPVWEAAARMDSLGWTAEMRIPFSQLRFSASDSLQSWGLQVWRYVDRLNEQDVWSFRPRNVASGPAFYGHLEALAIQEQPRQLEVMPYVVTGSRFERAAPGDPYGEDLEMRLGVGGDLKYLVTTNLTLDATFNPDFGQVEVDPASLNLSAFETYYDEKRPFFIAGSSAFRFGGMRCMFCSNSSGLGAFYSRRIGRPPQLGGCVDDLADYADAPENTSILAAAKLTGRTDGGYTIGVLNAVTGRETAHYLTEPGAIQETQVVEPLTNYFVGRAKKEFRGGATTFGGILTSTARRTADAVVDDRLHGHAEALGVDWQHSWNGRAYSWMGSALLSNVAGSAAAIARTQRSSARYFQRPDRTLDGGGLFDAAYDTTATSLRGYGMFSRVAKDAGTLRWEAMANVRSPGFEVNDMAFLNRSDYVWLNGNVAGSFTTPTRWYRNVFATFGGATEYNYDGDRTQANLQAFVGMELPNYWNVRLMGIHNEPALDDRPHPRRTRGRRRRLRRGQRAGLHGCPRHRRVRRTGAGRPRRGGRHPLPHRSARPRAEAGGQRLRPAVAQLQLRRGGGPVRDSGGRSHRDGVLRESLRLRLHQDQDAVPGHARELDIHAQASRCSSSPSRSSPAGTTPPSASSPRRARWTRSCTVRTWGPSPTMTRPNGEYDVDPDGDGPRRVVHLRQPGLHHQRPARHRRAALGVPPRLHALLRLDPAARGLDDPTGPSTSDGARSAIFDERPMNIFQVKATYWFGR